MSRNVRSVVMLSFNTGVLQCVNIALVIDPALKRLQHPRHHGQMHNPCLHRYSFPNAVWKTDRGRVVPSHCGKVDMRDTNKDQTGPGFT
ncbi:hypothetical protein D3C85_1753400 [compost metagenome]